MHDVWMKVWTLMTGRSWRGRVAVIFGALALLVACAGGDATPPPTGGVVSGVSISFPYEGQTLAGTIAVAAGGIGGRATNLAFELGSLRVSAAADGTATLNTRGLADGSYVLRAIAMVEGNEVRSEITVAVANALTSSGNVTAFGGALRTEGGSLAVVPPGALAAPAHVSVRDTTQAEILDEFGIDYPALGVTFLGAMTVASDAPRLDLPLQVDLNGWAEAVQPGQHVVMFMLAPDASGNGVGELMFAANAEATPDGSVITRPSPRSEVYGFGTASVARLQATAGGRPGEIVTLVGRGFNLLGAASNVVRFGNGRDLLLLPVVAEEAPFNPLMELQFALPVLGTASHTVTLHNLTTGHRTDPITVDVDALGSGSAAVFAGFVDQVASAVERLTGDRQDLAVAGAVWVAALGASGSSVAAAMAANSGLVSGANQVLIDAIGSGHDDLAQRRLVERHALVLDAMAASVPELAVAAADLATLLLTVAPRTPSTGAVSTLQTGGDANCSGTPPSASITIGVAGMGSASTASCNGGEFQATTGSGVTSLSGVHPSASRRGGSLEPVGGALVTIFRQGTTQRLSPFTTITDPNGYYYIPFVPPGEPFTIVASDPVSGVVARAEGVTGPVNQAVTRNLTYVGGGEPAGRPTTRFTLSDEGDGTYRFDASSSDRGDAEIATYRWEFGDGGIVTSPSPIVTHTYRVAGNYPVRLLVIDEAGVADEAFGTVELPPSYGIVLVRDHALDPVMDATGAVVALSAFTDETFLLSAGIRVHDLVAGTEVRADAAADGTPSDGTYIDDGIGLSRDGRYVSFLSYDATNLTTDYDPGVRTIYVKDLETGAIESVNRGDAGLSAGCLFAPSLSADGRHIAFRGEDSCFTSSFSSTPVFVKDLDAGSVRQVSFGGAAHASNHAIDGDGSTVVYVTEDSTVVAGDTNGFRDVFVWDAASGTVTRASLAFDGSQADDHVWLRHGGAGTLSDDGRYLLMHSSATNLVPGITNGQRNAFVRDLQAGTIERVSLNAAGEELTGSTLEPMLSGDGRYLLMFSAATNLVPGITDDRRFRLYVRDLPSGEVAWLDRTDLGKDPSRGVRRESFAISGDGRYVAFVSESQLVVGASPESLGVYRVENPLWTAAE